MRRSMRLIAVLLVVGAVGFGASAALGTTGSSTAGSLSFTVTSADTATKGQLMNYSGSIANRSQSAVQFQLTFTLTGPGGKSGSSNYYVGLGGGKSVTKSGSYRIPLKAPSGSYTLSMTIKTVNATGQATAQTTVS
jgi:hypothetical protein